MKCITFAWDFLNLPLGKSLPCFLREEILWGFYCGGKHSLNVEISFIIKDGEGGSKAS